MSKNTKLLLGILTIWPIAYVLLFIFLIFSQFILFALNGEVPKEPPLIILLIFPLHLLTMILMFGLLVIYIRDVFKNTHVKQDQKALWAVVLFMGNIIAMPIYWYLYIWKES